ncbi:MAG: ferredoxin [Acidimicrobiales bacterium]|mgnify:FL=1|jgi:ferredoxin|nr:ferredoxin [Acidimicrobiales bacterium]
MRVVVDFDLCESNAICMQIAPDVFEVRDDDFLYVLEENPGEDRRAVVEQSIQRCPKQAISLEE